MPRRRPVHDRDDEQHGPGSSTDPAIKTVQRRSQPGHIDSDATPQGIGAQAKVAQLQSAAGNRAVNHLMRTLLDDQPHSVQPLSIQPLSAPGSITVQRRTPNSRELESLAAAKKQLAELQDRYNSRKALIADALVKRGGFGNVLGYFQDLGWGHAVTEIENLDAAFQDLAKLARTATTNDADCRSYVAKVNSYVKSGGMNRFDNIFASIERELLREERNDTNQFTKLDEAYFEKYLSQAKPPITVYRGDGRDVTSDSFDSLPFATMPAGGTPDITFAGVVEHTHTNTLKNGMVSCTTDPRVALHFATSDHEYGVVWELLLDNYIHVAKLLKSRNFKYRFPGQFEVLYPGAVPGSKLVSATLYKKDQPLKKRTAG